MINISRHIFKVIVRPNTSIVIKRASLCGINLTNEKNDLVSEDFIEAVEYKAFSYERLPYKKRTISKLQELFGCTLHNAINIIKEVPELENKSIVNINEIVKICDKKLITINCIYNNPWILGIKAKDLEDKLELLDRIKHQNYDEVVPFLQLRIEELVRLTIIMEYEAPDIPGGSRHYYFQKMTKVNINTITKHFARRWFIYEVQFLHFRNILKFLLECGVTPMNILRDLWVFKYHPSKVRQRITLARRSKSKRIMPWMVRCKDEVFHNFLERARKKDTLLADRSIEDYLSDKLECSSDMAKYIVSSNASIKNIHVTKIQGTLDYLLGQGYTAYHIAQVPRILCHSLQTTKERIEELKAIGYPPSSLAALCKSKKEFSKYVSAVKRAKSAENKVVDKETTDNL